MTSAPRTARDFARIELTRAILSAARTQLAAVGPGELSLRAVARELGMASSAVYRYFPSREHLITALLVECYNESGAAVEAAESAVPRTRYRKRWLAAAGALRDWACTNSFEYALLYGSPVPGYAAPQDTIGPAQRVPQVLLGLMADVEEAGIPLGSPPVRLTRAQRAAVAPISAFVDGRIDDERLGRALMAWATLIGQTSLELFGHLHQGVLDYDVHFRRVMENVADDLGLPR
ncbi:TetR/AcrR family transcriptional regulator [Nocardioides limicola]|uniref:TetR/AcrR family transcriptional regulator n=1 Tax=Nocardioides limicola TaxID=2803368 RepID=UPI00193C1CF8|nr:TetR/AcrR family transcriptional regulator [Nocardioides sp. DJM-14]